MLKSLLVRETAIALEPTPERARRRNLARQSASRTRSRASAPSVPVIPESLARLAYERIRRAIVWGRLDLGEPLSEQELADALKMSKAPVRIALTELRVRGLVVTVPRSGTYVFAPTHDQVVALCDFRVLLEAGALRQAMTKLRVPFLAELDDAVLQMQRAIQSKDALAFKRSDARFHETFVQHSGNHYFISTYETISDLVETLRYRCVDPMVPENPAYVEHQEIVASLKMGQIDKAIKLLEKHIFRATQAHAKIASIDTRKRRRDYKHRNYADIL